jgi:hypothetical protein
MSFQINSETLKKFANKVPRSKSVSEGIREFIEAFNVEEEITMINSSPIGNISGGSNNQVVVQVQQNKNEFNIYSSKKEITNHIIDLGVYD